MEKRNCKQCKREFYEYKSCIANGRAVFCSKQCHAEWQRTNLKGMPFPGQPKRGTAHPNFKEKVELECRNCNVTFWEYPYRTNRTVFCSKNCQKEWQRKQHADFVCKQCEKVFRDVKSANRKFCNLDCYHKWLTGNKKLAQKVSEGVKQYYAEHPEARKANSAITKELWQNDDFVEKVWAGWQLEPNSKERELIRIIEKNELPLQFVGDGTVIVERKSPDFISSDGRKIVELYGDYWHKNDDPEDRIRFFKEHDKDCLVIWEHELEDERVLLDKIIAFLGVD